MRLPWPALMLGMTWSCGGHVGDAAQSFARDASVDVHSVADSSIDAVRDSEVVEAETGLQSCTFSGFGSPTTYKTAYVPNSIFVYSPRGGPPDFAVDEPYGPNDGGAESFFEFFANSGTGAFAPGTFHGASGNNFANAVTGDFRLSGFADVASIELSAMGAPNGVLTIDRNLDDGGYDNKLITYHSPEPGGNLAVGDFNGDGYVDLAMAGSWVSGPCLERCESSSAMSVYFNLRDGTLAPPVTYASGSMTAIATGDFNGDGHLDIALLPNAIMLNNGDGSFGDPVAVPSVLSSVSGMDASNYYATLFPWVVGDFNGDGLTDIATSAMTTANVNELIVFPCTGGGAFGQPITIALSGEVQNMVVGDFNGDGHSDIAIQYQTPSVADGGVNAPLAVGLLLNRGDGSFGSETFYAMGPNPCSIAVADFNGDGVSDLAVVNGGSGNGVTVMLSQCH